jgi:hypothetical protein
VCTIRATPSESRDSLLLQQLPRTASIIDINIDLVLHTYGQPATAPWTGYGHFLSTEQANQILTGRTAL